MLEQNQLNQITSEVTRRVRALLGPRLRSILLFGSYARGDYDEESDIDIMVLADIPDEDEIRALDYQINDISSDLCMEHGIMVCILLYNRTLFEQRLPVSPFYRNVIIDGVTLYAS